MASAPIETGSEPVRDEELIQRVADGDQAAFELLYERYFSRVYNFVARRLYNRADVEETVQEIFINVFSSMGSFRGEGPFAAWVLGLSRRTVASRFKKKRHATVPLDAGHESPDSLALLVPTVQHEPSPHEHYECVERMGRIAEAADKRLTEEQWRLVELHHLGHHSIQEIARTLDKSEDAIKSNLYRARKLLLAR